MDSANLGIKRMGSLKFCGTKRMDFGIERMGSLNFGIKRMGSANFETKGMDSLNFGTKRMDSLNLGGCCKTS